MPTPRFRKSNPPTNTTIGSSLFLCAPSPPTMRVSDRTCATACWSAFAFLKLRGSAWVIVNGSGTPGGSVLWKRSRTNCAAAWLCGIFQTPSRLNGVDGLLLCGEQTQKAFAKFCSRITPIESLVPILVVWLNKSPSASVATF